MTLTKKLRSFQFIDLYSVWWTYLKNVNFQTFVFHTEPSNKPPLRFKFNKKPKCIFLYSVIKHIVNNYASLHYCDFFCTFNTIEILALKMLSLIIRKVRGFRWTVRHFKDLSSFLWGFGWTKRMQHSLQLNSITKADLYLCPIFLHQCQVKNIQQRIYRQRSIYTYLYLNLGILDLFLTKKIIL